MAKPATTHVIELEVGIGEPGFVPLSLGEEQKPISVGRKAMWRLESAQVLDIHAFFYFDGISLFVQSADDAAPTFVDGQSIGTAWTEIHAPCTVGLGSARLRFRSLMPALDDAPPRPPDHRPPSNPPISRIPSAPPPRPAAGAPPNSAPTESPRSFPKTDRPFQPGPFASPTPTADSTRVAPVERTSRPSVSPMSSALPVARAEGPNDPHAMHRSGMPPPPTPSSRPARPSSPPAIFSPHGPSVPGRTYRSGQRALQDMVYAATTRGAPPAASTPTVRTRDGRLSVPKRILLVLGPLSLISAGYLLLFDDDRPARPVTTTDAAPVNSPATAASPPSFATAADAPAASGSASTSSVASPACPPGFTPYDTAINGVVPCVPANTQTPSAPPVVAASTAAPRVRTGGTSAKTLERQAVDHLAMGNYAGAARLYEQLQQQHPSNRVYAEAARILRAKADGSTP